jgi:FkbM family methyltransferase
MAEDRIGDRQMNFFTKKVARAILPNAVIGRLLQARLSRTIRRFPQREITVKWSGVDLRLAIRDDIAAHWYSNGTAPLPEIDFLRRHGLQPGATVFDLGAHQCVVALVAAEAVGPTGRVVAVEANPHNVEVSEQNKKLNNAHHLNIVGAAVGDVDGDIEFSFGLNGSITHGEGLHTGFVAPAVRIDTLASQYGQPNVLLLDLEGFEQKALSGARKVINRGATFLIEVHVDCGLEVFGGSVTGLAAMFPSEEYQLWMLSDQHPIAQRFDPASRLVVSRFYLVAVNRAINPDQSRTCLHFANMSNSTRSFDETTSKTSPRGDP